MPTSPVRLTKQQRLLQISDRITEQRIKRVKEEIKEQTNEVTKDTPEDYQKLVQSVNKYMKSKEYQRSQSVQKRIFKIPQTKIKNEDNDYIYLDAA